jgi:hypothetical protein
MTGVEMILLLYDRPCGVGAGGFGWNDHDLCYHARPRDSCASGAQDAKPPLGVFAGTNGITDPMEEAEQVVAILKKTGCIVEAHYYANEGRGVAKPENRIDAIARTEGRFDRYLKGRTNLRRASFGRIRAAGSR